MTRGSDTIREFLGLFQHLIFPHGAEEFTVHAHSGRTRLATLQDAVGEVLNIIQNFSTTANERVMLLSVNLQHESLWTVLIFNADDEAEIAKQGVQYLMSLFEGGHLR